MIKSMLAAALAAALITAPMAPALAQSAAPATAKSEKKAAKKLTPQQQKMKDCGAKWQDYKKTNNVKGRAEYRKFLKTCLKKDA